MSSTTTTSTTTLGGEDVEATALPVGSEHYVDVDLVCRAFELSGVWVLVEGDTSTRQPPGERHEGGTCTVQGEDSGTFRGDAEGRKSATFRRLRDGERTTCSPVAR